MKVSVIAITLFVITLLHSTTARLEIPACIQKMIEDAHATPRSSPFVSINSYLYRGKVTYLVGSGCCDRFNPLYDAECKQICAPSGGFIGRGDGKCTDFDQTAKLLGNIWTAPRG